MHVLQAGLDAKTVQFLASKRVTAHVGDGVTTVEDLVEWVQTGYYEAALVDLDATGWGPYLARMFRAKKLQIPIIGISKSPAIGSWPDLRATFLENGGDDLLVSPANPRELVASLHAASRRFKGSTVSILEFEKGNAKLKIDRVGGIVTVNGLRPQLTAKEYQILEMLTIGNGRIQSKEAIMHNLYSTPDDEVDIKIVDVFICKLRKKLGYLHADAALLIETVWGRGYRIDTNAIVARAPTAPQAA
jgi:DNA-binding response OmpR family regulator